MTDENTAPQTPPKPRWQPLSAIDRRVLGVLAEKAKTTPDIYPMSLNAICTGCNQKSNRDPLMQLEPDIVEESLDRLREMGAVGMVEGYGRVTKYRHYLYEWLGVEKVELSVMTELLLRGDQTEGELRGRASRMDTIADLERAANAAQFADGQRTRGFAHARGTRPRRSRTISTSRGKWKTSRRNTPAWRPRNSAKNRAKKPRRLAHAVPASTPSAPARLRLPPSETGGSADLRREVEELREQVKQLRADLETLSADHARLAEELRNLKDALGA